MHAAQMADSPSSLNEAGSRRAKRLRRRRVRRLVLLALVLVWTGTAAWHTWKPVPPGTHVATEWSDIPLDDIHLLVDTTVTDGRGQQIIRQQIFDEVFGVIDHARRCIVLDFFLFNDQRGSMAADASVHRALSRELTEHLLARKRALPDLHVLFVSDPINEVYGGEPSPAIAELRAAGIDFVVTDIDALRDSNPSYSAGWRLFVRWWANDSGGVGWLPNPMETGPSRVPLRAWLRLLNFKANHRKVIAADDGAGGWVAVVTSANPHDASSSHSNIGLSIRGQLARRIMDSEMDVARFSGWHGQWQPDEALPFEASPRTARVQYVTEGAIKNALLTALRTTQSGEFISIATFYLSDRDVLDALVEASQRDVRVRLILDPNKDAFGHSKDGVPNRPVAAELMRRGGGNIEVRWYRTHGEQFHTKLALVQRADAVWATLGSANYTRRNLDDYNLEANLALEADRDTPLARELVAYFETLWQNDPVAVREYTADFPTYEDESFARYWRYRLMEATGLSTF
jgi:phosphatidylserine/phosphatidylglycerophosphate/cardiolipin synthase-like enzyme